MLGGYAGVGEVERLEHRKLELVVHHVVVLARAPDPAQHLARSGEIAVRARASAAPQLAEIRLDQRVVLVRVLANGLLTERFLVRHVAGGCELAEHTRDHTLGHPGVQIERIIRAVIIPSRPKYVA